MSAIEFAQRRADLLARLDNDRDALADGFAALQGQLRVAETVVDAARSVDRHRAVMGVLAAAAVVAPFAARTSFKRAAWLLPLVIEGIRLVRSKRDEPGDDDEAG